MSDPEIQKIVAVEEELNAKWDLASTAKAYMLGETCENCTTKHCIAMAYVISPKTYVEYCRPRILASYFEVK